MIRRDFIVGDIVHAERMRHYEGHLLDCRIVAIFGEKAVLAPILKDDLPRSIPLNQLTLMKAWKGEKMLSCKEDGSVEHWPGDFEPLPDSTKVSHPFEASGLNSNQTGLPFYIWLFARAGARHHVRVMCSPTFKHDPANQTIIGLRPSLHTISGKPLSDDHMAALAAFVAVNNDTIMDFWDEEIDALDLSLRMPGCKDGGGEHIQGDFEP